jgi:hypothetical protein
MAVKGQGRVVDRIDWAMKTVRRRLKGGRRKCRRCRLRRRVGDMLRGIEGLLRRGMGSRFRKRLEGSLRCDNWRY